MELAIAYGAATDVGKQRESNEDSYVARSPLFAVADGMGGARAGEVASRLAVDTLVELCGECEGEPDDAVEILSAAAREGNRRIYEAAEHERARHGMGTTLTAVMLCGTRAATVHIGDSRLYRLRGGQLEQLTQDHSLVAEMVREGRLAADAAVVHPYRSVLSRALGTEPEADIDAQSIDVEVGDVLLLCSDGLSGPVSPEKLRKALGVTDPQKAARRLVDEALRRGGPDNVTAVVVRFLEGAQGGRQSVALDDDRRSEAASSPDDPSGVDGGSLGSTDDRAPRRRSWWRRGGR